MKLNRIRGVLCAMALLFVASTPLTAQGTPAERIAEADRLILEAEAGIAQGKKIMVIGAGVHVLSWVALVNADTGFTTLTGIGFMAGSVGMVWGAYTWYSASQDRSRLQSTRLQITIAPQLQQVPVNGLFKPSYGVVFRVAF